MAPGSGFRSGVGASSDDLDEEYEGLFDRYVDASFLDNDDVEGVTARGRDEGAGILLSLGYLCAERWSSDLPDRP